MGKPLRSHIPCVDTKHCGSSDGATEYESDNNGRLYVKCFSCGNTYWGPGVSEPAVASIVPINNAMLASYATAKTMTMPSRGIDGKALDHYGVKSSGDHILFPYFKDKELVALKLREKAQKKFSSAGPISTAELFGQQAFNKGGRYVTIHEGEFDAVAAFQISGHRYCNVSVRSASTAIADCKAAYEWLNSFDEVIISFDADEPGQKAAGEVAKLFAGKAKVIKHAQGYKDANDYLIAGQQALYDQVWWRAEPYVIDGIINGNTLFESLKKPRALPLMPFPWQGVNEMMYGIYGGKLYTITAGSGMGKTAVCKELFHHIHKHTQDKIGMMCLEESVEDAALSLMSVEMSKPLHVPGVTYSDEEYDKAFKATAGSGKIYFHDHFGSTSTDNILSRVRYLAVALGCKFILLDHISIVVSAQGNSDERKAIDELMTKLRMLVQETGVTLFVVSHLKRPEGKQYEEGAAVSLGSLRGSGSIGQLSDFVFSLERNGQASDLAVRNTTLVRSVKNRMFGMTGPMTGLRYDHKTGRLTEVQPIEEEAL